MYIHDQDSQALPFTGIQNITTYPKNIVFSFNNKEIVPYDEENDNQHN